MNRLRDTEEREDIKLLAARYSSLLAQKKSPEYEKQLLNEEDFLGVRMAARVLAKDKDKEPLPSRDSKERSRERDEKPIERPAISAAAPTAARDSKEGIVEPARRKETTTLEQQRLAVLATMTAAPGEAAARGASASSRSERGPSASAEPTKPALPKLYALGTVLMMSYVDSD